MIGPPERPIRTSCGLADIKVGIRVWQRDTAELGVVRKVPEDLKVTTRESGRSETRRVEILFGGSCGYRPLSRPLRHLGRTILLDVPV